MSTAMERDEATGLTWVRAITIDAASVGSPEPTSDLPTRIWAEEQLGADPVCWALVTAQRMADQIVESVPIFGSDAGVHLLLRRAVEGTTLRLLITLLTDDTDAVWPAPEPADAVTSYVRRQIPLEDVLRSISVSQEVFTRLLLEQVSVLVPTERINEETRATLSLVFRTYDLFSSAIASYYLRDAERWAQTTAAVQTRHIERALQATATAEVAELSRELDYDLTGSHLAAVFWMRAPRLVRRAPEAIEAAIHHLLATTGRPAHLVRWVGPATAQVWLQVDDPAAADGLDLELAHVQNLHLAVGSVAAGISGFRSSHESARATERLAHLAGPRLPWLVTHRSVQAITLLLHDLPGLQAFVIRTLGALAADEPRAEELRTSLEAYLAAGRSSRKAAATLPAHRNTVVYRVRSAEQLLPPGSALDSMELRLALRVCELLGPRFSES
ncbi:hypothetical protein CGZ94_20060 [Enemella evansiae]|uniref:PucR family transcriptional regulator n=1 Tax=Enemella evansiae TaxID=2016499 RepID=A0A255FYM6_9ACTN|nr:helix-turn-helix domain-containing protein [Enemella evansiae]OYO08798.1 hypothetical protein CGZ94_20060 [Enemella evansiae]